MSQETPATLVPKRKADKVQILAYSADYNNFKKFIEALNSDFDGDGEYTEEDVFSFMLAKTMEAFPKQKSQIFGKVRRGRKPKGESANSEKRTTH